MSKFRPNFAFSMRVIIVVLIVWFVILLLLSSPWWSSDGSDSGLSIGDEEALSLVGGRAEGGEAILARLSRAASELKSLKEQNEELRNWLNTYFPPPDFTGAKFKDGVQTGPDEGNMKLDYASQMGDMDRRPAYLDGPNMEQEQARRRLESNINEMWFYSRHQMNSTQLKLVTELRAAMLTDLGIMTERDEKWRRGKLQKLSEFIQKSLKDLQNPAEGCANVKQLVCHLNKGCGFGCQIHHVTYCFIVAMATKRTLILDSKNWRYTKGMSERSPQDGWLSVFEPVSETCTTPSDGPRAPWGSANMASAQVLELPIVDSLRPRPKYLPLTIPSQLAETMERLHGTPIVYFIGEIVKFIMRPSEEMKSIIESSMGKFGFRHPIVGVHVRRTDKVGTEARYHALSEYMQFVADYYDRMDQRNVQLMGDKARPLDRLVYLATDDQGLWKREIGSWRDRGYIFLGDSTIAKSAGVSRRYAIDSLKNIILDIWLLSQSDYLVCTFSSQVCRLAFELMNTRTLKTDGNYSDWSHAYYSLDDIYYFGGQNDHNQKAILSNDPKESGTMSMKIGDLVGIAGNHWDGFSKGLNRRTQQSALYPSFKAVEDIPTEPFKLFEGFDKNKFFNQNAYVT